MQLQESGEMYLETIYLLTREGKRARSVDVGNHMGFSKPSVSRAIGLLKSGGYVAVEGDGNLVLTEAGLEVAKRTYERHALLTEVFLRLGVDREPASADACKIEHVISEETFSAIRRFVEKG